MLHLQEFVAHYGYLLLFGWVFAEQMGMPIPTVPLLLAAGALAGTGRLNAALVLALPIAAAVTADFLWYELGKYKGIRVLQILCRISIEPDSCVRRTEDTFVKRGARSLLIAKFIPGLSIAAPPLAGIFRMKTSRFLSMDILGATFWATTYLALGFIFRNQLEVVARHAAHLGAGLVVILVATVAGWFVWKVLRRRRFIRQLRVDRITPQELKRKLDAGENVVVVDLRGSLDFEGDPEIIPGALHLEVHDVEHVKDELARAPEVVLYCT